MSNYIICCAVCGKSVIRSRTNQRYCSAACSKEAKRAQTRANNRRERELLKSERDEMKIKVPVLEAPPPRRRGMFDLTGKELGDVALEARSLGMSYGEYVTASTAGTISARLAERGISLAQAKKKIEKGYSERVPVKKRRRTTSNF